MYDVLASLYMRPTLDPDDDLLAAAMQLARQKGLTLGQVITELARQALETKAPLKTRNGALLFVPEPGASRPDLRAVNKLRDEP